MISSRWLLSLVVSTTLIMPLPALSAGANADSDKKITLELNNLTQHDNVCRLSFMVHNGLDSVLTDLGLEIVLMDTNGLAQDFMMLRTGRLVSDKRRVRQFDLPDVVCSSLGEILINDVSDCQGEGLTPESCLGVLNPISKSKVKLGL